MDVSPRQKFGHPKLRCSRYTNYYHNKVLVVLIKVASLTIYQLIEIKQGEQSANVN